MISRKFDSFEQVMRGILFFSFLLVYLGTAGATLYGFLYGVTHQGANVPYLSLLVPGVLLETAAGYFALYYDLFGLRQKSNNIVAPIDAAATAVADIILPIIQDHLESGNIDALNDLISH